MKTTVLTLEDVRTIVQRVGLDALMDETIARLTDAFLHFDPAKVVVPMRDGFKYDSPQSGLLEWMPGMRVGERAHIKVVGYHPDNADRHDLPTILSTLSMYSLHDGHLIGVMDATFITALRTGAASAIASEILARPESASLGLIGCGAQAVTQLHALSRVFPLQKVYIHDTDPDTTLSFARRVGCLGLDGLSIEPLRPQDFLPRVDLLCTATSVDIEAGPVFVAAELKPWIHVNAVGSDFPGKTEVPWELLRESLVCPDFEAQAIKEGECQQLAPEEIGPDLHSLVKDREGVTRVRMRKTVFDSTGWAFEDMVCMEMFMEYAAEFEIGRFLELESISSDCRNPYQFLFDAPDTSGAVPDVSLLRQVV